MSGSLRRMFAQPGFAVLAAALGLLAFNWPFLDLARTAGQFELFEYLFAIWLLLVLAAFVISRAVAKAGPEEDGGDV